MAKYLIAANYKVEGVKGLLKEGGSGRRQAVDKLLASVGGKVDSFYYAFGDTDAYVVVDVPDNITAAAIALTVAASGAVNLKTTRPDDAGGGRPGNQEEPRLSRSRRVTSIGWGCPLRTP